MKIDMNGIVDDLNPVRREVPKIAGSSSAFIVVIVVLVAIITVSCSAIIYFLREEGALGSRVARFRRRYHTQPLVDGDLPSPRQSKKWYSSFWGSRDQNNHVQLDKSTTMMGHRGQGWTQGNNSDWNIDSTDERALRFPEGTQSIPLRMSEQELSGSVYTPRVHSLTSDSASSVRYDPHAVHGLPYPERYALSPQPTILSLQSQLYSPTPSSPSSPVPRQIMRSPEPIANESSHGSSHDSVRDSLTQSVPPVLHTLGSGTKFFESL